MEAEIVFLLLDAAPEQLHVVVLAVLVVHFLKKARQNRKDVDV